MAEKGVFSRLRRLFSTDVVIRNVGGNQIKTIDSGHIQSSGEYETNSLIDRFNRVYSTMPTSLYGAQFNLNYQYLRTQLYSEYDVMDQDAIIASALDIVADECTLKNDMGEVLQIRSSNEDIQKLLYNLFYDVLNVEFNLWMWVRQMCKYGDFFLKLDIAEKFGVYNVIPYTAYHIERIEGSNPNNPAEVKYKWNPDGFAGSSYGYYNVPGQQLDAGPDDKGAIIYDNYEMAHFRMVGDVNYLPYGRAYIEPARKLFKQYTLMEDAMLIHRIARAPEKRVFYVNVGAIPPNEVEAFMQKTISNMKRTPLMDEKTGEYNQKYNMQNMLEDFYIPVRGNDQSTKIDTTPGLQYDGIADVEYLREKLFAALKIPKAFLGYDENIEGKATLAAEDIRFARTIDRIQRILLSELNKIALVHLYTQGFTGENLTNFEIKLTNPSIIFEQEKVALMKEKIDLANQMKDSKLFATDYIYDNIFNLSEDQYMEMRELVREDAKRVFRLAQLETEGNDPASSGRSYGTPHDLASMYGRRATATEKTANVPAGYNEVGPEGGRPREKMSVYGTNADPLGGRDRLGVQGMQGGFPSDNENIMEIDNTKAQTVFHQIKDSFQKEMIYEKKDNNESTLLDENQLKDLDN